MKPSVGRIVHFHHPSCDGPAAAIVTQVFEDDSANLAVFFSSGGHGSHFLVPFSEEPKAGCWSWPPRAEGVAARVEQPKEA